MISKARRRHRRDAAHTRARLTHDLQSFTSQADLADLAALLDRHDDRETGALRDAVDWTRAA